MTQLFSSMDLEDPGQALTVSVGLMHPHHTTTITRGTHLITRPILPAVSTPSHRTRPIRPTVTALIILTTLQVAGITHHQTTTAPTMVIHQGLTKMTSVEC